MYFNSLPPSGTDFSVCVTLTEQRWFHTAVQVYKVLHKLLPLYLNDTFQLYAVDITSTYRLEPLPFVCSKSVNHLSKHNISISGKCKSAGNSWSPTISCMQQEQLNNLS